MLVRRSIVQCRNYASSAARLGRAEKLNATTRLEQDYSRRGLLRNVLDHRRGGLRDRNVRPKQLLRSLRWSDHTPIPPRLHPDDWTVPGLPGDWRGTAAGWAHWLSTNPGVRFEAEPLSPAAREATGPNGSRRRRPGQLPMQRSGIVSPARAREGGRSGVVHGQGEWTESHRARLTWATSSCWPGAASLERAGGRKRTSIAKTWKRKRPTSPMRPT